MKDEELIPDQIEARERMIARIPASMRIFGAELVALGQNMGMKVDFELQVRPDRAESEFVIIVEPNQPGAQPYSTSFIKNNRGNKP